MTPENYSPGSEAPYVILAALSSDETGDFALFEAARLADKTPGAELHVVHVVGEDGSADSARDLVALDQRLQRAPRVVEQQIQRVQASLPARVIAHIRAGAAARSILQTAVDIGADVIVVGSHQRTRLEKMIVGSVAERVLRGSHCPVLVALPKSYEGAQKSESIEPPCPDCLVARQQSGTSQYWCERHRRAYHEPHVYEPTETRTSASVMPTH